MAAETINLTFGTVGELRRILNRSDLRDDTHVTLAIVGYVGEANPYHDGTGHDEFRATCRKVTILERPGTVQPQHVRLS